MDRGTGRGLVPEPVAELPARRPAGPGRSRFEVVGLNIIDRETQHQRPRERLARAWRRFAAQPVRDIPAALADRQSAKTDPGAAGLRSPRLTRTPELRDLRLELCGERLGRAGGGWCGYRRRAPAGIGLPARVVIGEILDDHRAVVAFEQAQRRENDAPLECRLTGWAKRPAQLERNPQRARRSGVLCLRTDQADRDRCNPLFFEIVSQ